MVGLRECGRPSRSAIRAADSGAFSRELTSSTTAATKSAVNSRLRTTSNTAPSRCQSGSCDRAESTPGCAHSALDSYAGSRVELPIRKHKATFLDRMNDSVYDGVHTIPQWLRTMPFLVWPASDDHQTYVTLFHRLEGPVWIRSWMTETELLLGFS